MARRSRRRRGAGRRTVRTARRVLTPPQGWYLDDRRGRRELEAHELEVLLDADTPLLAQRVPQRRRGLTSSRARIRTRGGRSGGCVPASPRRTTRSPRAPVARSAARTRPRARRRAAGPRPSRGSRRRSRHRSRAPGARASLLTSAMQQRPHDRDPDRRRPPARPRRRPARRSSASTAMPPAASAPPIAIERRRAERADDGPPPMRASVARLWPTTYALTPTSTPSPRWPRRYSTPHVAMPPSTIAAAPNTEGEHEQSFVAQRRRARATSTDARCGPVRERGRAHDARPSRTATTATPIHTDTPRRAEPRSRRR